MAGGILLAFIAFFGQHVDNLLLSYAISKWNHVTWYGQQGLSLVALTMCLTPGIRNRRIIPWIQQSLLNFWTNKVSKTEEVALLTNSSLDKTKAQWSKWNERHSYRLFPFHFAHLYAIIFHVQITSDGEMEQTISFYSIKWQEKYHIGLTTLLIDSVVSSSSLRSKLNRRFSLHSRPRAE